MRLVWSNCRWKGATRQAFSINHQTVSHPPPAPLRFNTFLLLFSCFWSTVRSAVIICPPPLLGLKPCLELWTRIIMWTLNLISENNPKDPSFQVLFKHFLRHFLFLFHPYSDWATITYMRLIYLMAYLLCFQTAKGYILLFDVLGGGDDKYLYEPVYPRYGRHTFILTISRGGNVKC